MTLFYNQTQPMGVIFDSLTNNITGSLFLSMLMLALIFMALCFLFRLPVEISVAFVLPLHLVAMAYTTEYIAVGGSFLIYLAVIVAKWFFW